MLKKFKQLSRLSKLGVVVGVITLLGIASSTSHPQSTQMNVHSASVLGAESDSGQQSKAKAPVITTRQTTETQPIPFSSSTVNDATLASGKSKLITTGVNGVSTLTYKLTFSDGKQTKKELVSQVTTTAPVTQVTALGTYVAPAPKPANPNCDPNYSGACVPIASDVDCAGGSGNGPAYVAGPVYVIGTDIYGLDRDGDGVGCE